MKVKLALLLTLIGTLPLAAQNVRQEQDTVSYMNDDPSILNKLWLRQPEQKRRLRTHRSSLR